MSRVFRVGDHIEIRAVSSERRRNRGVVWLWAVFVDGRRAEGDPVPLKRAQEIARELDAKIRRDGQAGRYDPVGRLPMSQRAAKILQVVFWVALAGVGALSAAAVYRHWTGHGSLFLTYEETIEAVRSGVNPTVARNELLDRVRDGMDALRQVGATRELGLIHEESR